MQRVKDTENLIRQSPNIGSIDPLFVERAKTYRSIIVNSLNKIVYYIEDDTLHIAVFWDTRREPKTHASPLS